MAVCPKWRQEKQKGGQCFVGVEGYLNDVQAHFKDVLGFTVSILIVWGFAMNNISGYAHAACQEAHTGLQFSIGSFISKTI